MSHETKETSGSGEPSPSDAVPSRYKPLRIWPVVLLLGGMVLLRLLPSLLEDGPPQLWMSAAFGPMLCGVLVVLWWLIGSRATWAERLVGFAGVIAALFATLLLVHESMRGPATPVLTIPMGTAAFATGAVLCSRVLAFKRTVVALLMAVCGFGFSTMLRNDGMWGDFSLGLDWRWHPSAEEQLLADRATRAPAATDALAAPDIDQWLAEPEWPGFRGADRNGRQRGTQISSDWSGAEPELLWKVAVGPAWSSFAVAGNLLFTQEQRGPLEAVVCYDANTGREIWSEQLESRFDDPLGGPGPRATPTLAGNALYVMGAQGWLLRLDPRTGKVAWKQDLRQVADRQPPMWGFSASPLVLGQAVIVYAGGAGDKGTLAFDVDSGELRWSAPAGEHSYSSPHPISLGGEELVLMLTNRGVKLLRPSTGEVRLDYQWNHQGYRALQPQVVDGDTVLLPTGIGAGTRRIRLSSGDGKWSADELWTSRNLKPDFNDCVIYQGHAYGFDGSIFACINLDNGDRAWKGGRYGKGQVLLLEDSGLLLVLSEVGEVVLLKADPSAHIELVSFKALDGKTWNHPVVVGDRLYVRTSQEAACSRLPSSATHGNEPLAAGAE